MCKRITKLRCRLSNGERVEIEPFLLCSAIGEKLLSRREPDLFKIGELGTGIRLSSPLCLLRDVASPQLITFC